MSTLREVASGLRFPEGPVALSDGSVLVVEIARGTLSRVSPDGGVEVVADTGGGPNGAAVGPDGTVWICNNGGFEWREVGGRLFPGHQPAGYRGGSIQRVDLASGAVETVYRECDGRPLRGPNDLVFDRTGGFWFTDHGKTRERERDRTGLFYARPDGAEIREAVFPLEAPNGVALSPEQDRVYVAETTTGRVFYWNLAGPGEIAPHPRSPHGGYLLAGLPGLQMLDSMAVDADGNVCVATLVHGGITVIAPDGEVLEHLPTGDPLTTNLCFGGPGRRTAWITLSSTGRLAALEWKRPGLELAFGR
ncbi:MAG TPA: SMP-30/gluconolactonase/LRE family protein [Thermoanaerobaculia bacterium]|nr:SMP-30/gluconolactonase/LRE family protein [Thermoanaerobaculia bacterium]